MEQALFVLLGAGVAHTSAVIMEYGRRRLNRDEKHAERRLTFESDQLLGTQAALIALMETTRLAREAARGGPSWGTPGASGAIRDQLHADEAALRRCLVLLADAPLRGQATAAGNAFITASTAATEAESDAAWTAARQLLDEVNSGIGTRVRSISLAGR